MKTIYQMDSLPQSGVRVTLEGALVRLLFDFTPAPVVEEEGREPVDNLYACESVDVRGRSYGDIVGAIVNSRYSQDQYQALLANYELAKDEGSELDSGKRAEYMEEYSAFQAWRVHAKEIAKIVLEEIEAVS